MDERVRDEPGPRRHWARTALAGIEAAEETEDALAQALDPHPDVQAENNVRRARAVHAAAMGLGPAGCAAAAGVPEAMLAKWRAQDPAFDTALTAASALAGAHQVAAPGKVSGLGLRLLLQAVARGVHTGTAATYAGLRSDQLLRLRRSNPLVSELVDVALQQARDRRGSRRRPRRTPTYRLVSIGEQLQPPPGDDRP
ncbi:hypothetical protein OOK31_26630 [Streptomyces sp. NBC_00249]|uniref:hypothetical protein n=1 Tax=Streptomyces sp. NBC_00249 TaxID=2975690 RepID=UPI002250EEA6|nr:hypothetical protein [Streptomyces sp. NBC_00249]MCX5197429.1 hypothetical protein [Streptomyces sp. NBC_00249]